MEQHFTLTGERRSPTILKASLAIAVVVFVKFKFKSVTTAFPGQPAILPARRPLFSHFVNSLKDVVETKIN